MKVNGYREGRALDIFGPDGARLSYLYHSKLVYFTLLIVVTGKYLLLIFLFYFLQYCQMSSFFDVDASTAFPTSNVTSFNIKLKTFQYKTRGPSFRQIRISDSGVLMRTL